MGATGRLGVSSSGFRNQVEGWTSLMIVLLLTSGTQLVMLGMIGEYVWRSLEQTRRRPLFVVEKLIEQPEQSPNADRSLAEDRQDYLEAGALR